MKAITFTGEYFERGITRKIETVDPATNRTVSKLARLDLVTDLVIDRVSGAGKSERTGEQQVTLSGQYAPFRTLRITASAQNAQKVIEMLKGNVAADTGEGARLLKSEIVVKAAGTPMKGFGMVVHELYLKSEDGSYKTIIGPPASTESSEPIADQFL